MTRLHQTCLLLLAAALTALVFGSPGTHDVQTWLTWGRHAHEHGIVEAYARDGNLYPPFANVLLWLSYECALALDIAPLYTLKGLLLVFLLATIVVFYRWSGRNAMATALFYAAMLYSALGLGYLDILFAFPLLLALYCLQQHKLTLFSVCFLLACLVKFPPLLVAPFFLVYLCATAAPGWRATLVALLKRMVLPCLLLLVPVLALFGKTLLIALVKTSGAPWLSAWALNFNWIVTRIYLQHLWGTSYPAYLPPTFAMMSPVPDTARLLARGLYLFFFLATLASFVRCRRSFEHLLLYATLASFAYFMFYTGVHENHLFLACVLAAALYCVNANYFSLFAGLLFVSSLNLFVFYGTNGTGNSGFLFHPDTPYSYWTDAPLLIAAGNVIYFLALWCSTVIPAWRERFAS
jgi:hypothetical protein